MGITYRFSRDPPRKYVALKAISKDYLKGTKISLSSLAFPIIAGLRAPTAVALLMGRADLMRGAIVAIPYLALVYLALFGRRGRSVS
jgi:hypothetical protein